MTTLRFTKTPYFYSRLSLACGYVGLSQRAHGRVALETRRTNSQLPFNRFSERNRKTKLLPKLAAYPRNELKRVVVEASQEKLSKEGRDGMTACRRGGNRRPGPRGRPSPPATRAALTSPAAAVPGAPRRTAAPRRLRTTTRLPRSRVGGRGDAGLLGVPLPWRRLSRHGHPKASRPSQHPRGSNRQPERPSHPRAPPRPFPAPRCLSIKPLISRAKL